MNKKYELLNTAKEIFDKHEIDTHVERNTTGIGLYNSVNETIFFTYTTFYELTSFYYPSFLSYTCSVLTIVSNIMCRCVDVYISYCDVDSNIISNLSETYVKYIDSIKRTRNDCNEQIEELTQLYSSRSKVKPLSFDKSTDISYDDLLIDQKTRHLNVQLNQLFKIYSQEIQLIS